jgi:hypothetical protein
VTQKGTGTFIVVPSHSLPCPATHAEATPIAISAAPPILSPPIAGEWFVIFTHWRSNSVSQAINYKRARPLFEKGTARLSLFRITHCLAPATHAEATPIAIPAAPSISIPSAPRYAATKLISLIFLYYFVLLPFEPFILIPVIITCKCLVYHHLASVLSRVRSVKRYGAVHHFASRWLVSGTVRRPQRKAWSWV